MKCRAIAILLLAAASIFLPPCRLSAAESNTNHPNILFLFSDDQRADTIGALGNSHVHTPNVDRLVKEGTSFTRAYCMGGMQGAICVPSRAMLMSGRTLFRVKEQLQGQDTWPEQFAAAGYRTFITGKWHNGPQSVLKAFQNGKAVFLGGMGDPYKLPVADFTADHKIGEKRPSGKHSIELFADTAIGFLKSRKKDDPPFLCYVPFNAPHDPRIAPAPYHEASNKEKPPLPANFMPVHPFNNGDMTLRDEQLAPWPRTPDIVRQNLADYYASIAWIDVQVGRILEALRESGQYENTIIVYSSDHGLAIGSHGLFGKQNLYDMSMHAPLIFAGPGVSKDKRTDAMCYLLDIFPTLGDLTGVKGPAGSEGISLVPAMKDAAMNNSGAGRPALLTAYRSFQRAVRDDRWKLIVYPQINKVQLFDLKEDPAEMKDLSADPAFAKERERMMDLLKKQQAAYDDKQPLSTDKPQSMEFDFSKVKRTPAKE
jgi:arylsulfatase A-like enzyme